MADEIVNGFKEVGFIYLEGHGIPSSTVDGVFKKVRNLIRVVGYSLVNQPLNQSAEFFRLPSSVKVCSLLIS